MTSPAELQHPRTQTGVSVVALLWRNQRFALPFIQSLVAAVAICDEPVELVLVKNGRDGDAALREIRSLAEEGDLPARLMIRLIELEENNGYARGMNLGSAICSGRIVVYANLDLVFDQRFLLDAESYTGEEDALVVPCIGSYGEPPEEAPCRTWRISWLGGLVESHRIQTNGALETEAFEGTCLVLPRRVAVALGWPRVFWEDLFSYAEDRDLNLRVLAAGIPVLVDTRLKVAHFRGGSVEGRTSVAQRPLEWQALIIRNIRAVCRANPMSCLERLGVELGAALRIARIAASRPSATARLIRAWRDGAELGARRHDPTFSTSPIQRAYIRDVS